MTEKEQDNFMVWRKGLARETGAVYSLTAVLPVFLMLFILTPIQYAGGEGFTNTDAYRYLTYLLPQLSFALIAVIYFLRTKQPLRVTFQGCKWYFFLLAVLVQFGLLFSVGELNGLFLSWMQSLGFESSGIALPSMDGWNILPVILAIAVLPAIFEELIFCAILVKNMSAMGWGTWATVLISGAMFSLFHSRIEQTLFQFVCGACFALITVKSGSALPTMLSHFLNNALVIIVSANGINSFSQLPFGVYLTLCIASALGLIASLFILIFKCKGENGRGGVKEGKLFFTAAGVGIFVLAFTWILNAYVGFIGG